VGGWLKPLVPVLFGAAATLGVLLSFMDVGPRPAPVLDAVRPTPVPASAGAGERVVVALQLQDCSEVPGQLNAWLRARAYEPGQVTGVLVGSGSGAQAAQRVLESLGAEFEIDTEGAREVSRLLVAAGFTHTPAVLVFDESGRLTRLLDREQIIEEAGA
jgi:hypothetical protein